MVNRYSDKEIEFVVSNRNKLSVAEIAKHLNRSYYSVANVNRRLLKSGIIKKAYRHYHCRYNEWQENYILDHVGIMSYRQIAEKLNRSETAIREKATRLNASFYSNFYSGGLLAKELGKSRKTIIKWHKKGFINGKIGDWELYGHKPYIFIEKDIVAFLRKHHNLFNNLKTVSNLYFKNVLDCAKQGIKLEINLDI